MSTWVVLIIVAREFAVTGLRLVAAGGAEVIGASQLGKLKAFSQNVMVVCLLLAAPRRPLDRHRRGDRAHPHRVVVRRLLLARAATTSWPAARDVSEHVTDVVLIAAAYLAGSLPFGYWLVKRLPAPGHPHAGVAQHGRDQRLAQLRLALRRRHAAARRRQGRAPDARRAALVGPAASRRSPASRRCSGTAIPCCSASAGARASRRAPGAALALFPAGVGLAALAWAIVFLTTRYASLASLSAGAVFVIAAVVLGEPWPVIAFAALAFGFVALRHRANIARLRAGTEPRARLRRATSGSGS